MMADAPVRLEIFGRPWAISSAELRALASVPASLVRMAGSAPMRRAGGTYGSVAVIPVRGIIRHRENQMFGGTSAQMLTTQFRQALADSSVRAIVFDIDSPGGEIGGTLELANEIFGSRARKKTVAVANCQACCGAYWLASAASEVVVAPSGSLGEIGIVAAHTDNSAALQKAGVSVSLISAGRYKTEGNPFEPLAQTARDEMQRNVNAFYEQFVQSVARGRGVSAENVRSYFGEGRSVLARQAVAERMADRTGTLDDTLARLSSAHAGQGRTDRVALHRIGFGSSRPWQRDLDRRRRELDLV